jgi:hypothetical protein
MMLTWRGMLWQVVSFVEILIYGLILLHLFHQSVVVALHYDSIMSYYSS